MKPRWKRQRVPSRISSPSTGQVVADPQLDIGMAEPMTQAVAAYGRAMPATTLWASLNGAVLVSHHMWTLFETVDCILSPMLSSAPLA